VRHKHISIICAVNDKRNKSFGFAPISTASSFGKIGVGSRTKDRNPTSQILPQILPWDLLRLQD
jgi:hypothetical protein